MRKLLILLIFCPLLNATITLSNGSFQDPAGHKVANGTLVLTLSTAAEVISSPNGEIVTVNPVVLTLDGNGNLSGTPTIFSNAELSPSGTWYYVQVFSSSGAALWAQAQIWIFTQAAGMTVNLSTMIPVAPSGPTYPNPDSTYARLDGVNMPFTGPVRVQCIGCDQTLQLGDNVAFNQLVSGTMTFGSIGGIPHIYFGLTDLGQVETGNQEGVVGGIPSLDGSAIIPYSQLVSNPAACNGSTVVFGNRTCAAPGGATSTPIPLAFSSGAAVSNSVSNTFGVGSLGSEAQVQWPVPKAGTVGTTGSGSTGFYCRTNTTLSSTQSYTITMRKGLAATGAITSSSQSITCTMNSTNTSSCNDTTHTFTVAVGDVLDVQVVPANTPSVSLYELFGNSAMKPLILIFLLSQFSIAQSSLGGTLNNGQLGVSNATLQSITVSPSSTIAADGGTATYVATGNLSNGTQIAVTPAWTSANPSIATINSSGVATCGASANGTTTITASFEGFSGTATLTCEPIPIISTLSCGSATIGVAYACTIAATGGSLPYAWALIGGTTLPSGLSLSCTSGCTTTTITGVPLATGITSFTIQVTESAGGFTGTQTYSINVQGATAQAPTLPQRWVDGRESLLSSYTNTVTVNGSSTWSCHGSSKGPYAISLAGLNSAIADTEACRSANGDSSKIVIPHGSLISQSFSGATYVNLKQTGGDSSTSPINITSDAPLPTNDPLTTLARDQRVGTYNIASTNGLVRTSGSGSPALNAGTTSGAPTTDFDGMARGSTPSIGAYQQ